MKTLETKLAEFAAKVQADSIARLHRDKLACEANIENAKTSVKMGKKFARVDIGYSGRYMVDIATQEIFGIKGYGVIHRGYRFGTLDTVNEYFWGDYRAIKNTSETAKIIAPPVIPALPVEMGAFANN